MHVKSSPGAAFWRMLLGHMALLHTAIHFRSFTTTNFSAKFHVFLRIFEHRIKKNWNSLNYNLLYPKCCVLTKLHVV